MARCRQAFTPFAPIELPEFFAGRASVIEDIRGELDSPGRQVAIHGERGVGKTSLAALLYFFARYDDKQVHFVRCGQESTYDGICRSLLTSSGVSLALEGVHTESSKGVRGQLASIGGEFTKKSTLDYRSFEPSNAFTAERMLREFDQTRALLIIDEYDRVREDRNHARMAETIKHFSDARSQTKIVIVGVADTLTQLIGEHESLSRSLAQIRLERMDEIELEQIIESGEQRTGVSFDRKINHRITRLADGFPHFVHLICLYSCFTAADSLLAESKSRPVVREREYRAGLSSAIKKAEHSLQETYDAAVVTTRRKSDIYELVLKAMALDENRDVQVRDIAKHASLLAGEPQRPEKFSNALGQLVKPERGQALTKVRNGFYKFTNPLMRAYVRFLLEYDNIVNHNGQFEFPFMRS